MKTSLGIFARGLCMGAADVVPGVSGGTMARMACGMMMSRMVQLGFNPSA